VSYRPIADVWILARSKVKYFGAYPAGFLQRARDMLNVSIDDSVLHVCAGRVRDYPYKGVGPNDVTMDLDESLKPDIFGDAGAALDYERAIAAHPQIQAVLADPPYTPEFATRYKPGAEKFPTGDAIVRNSIDILPIGGRVGILSLGWPRYPKTRARQVAIVGVLIGNGNLGRWFAVYEKIAA
jgi:hypothetical protein